MSEREKAQQKLAEWLQARRQVFTAPYGIIRGLHAIGHKGGKIRTVTFGVARYLDATATFWAHNRIEVDAHGGLCHMVIGQFGSVEELIAHLDRRMMKGER